MQGSPSLLHLWRSSSSSSSSSSSAAAAAAAAAPDAPSDETQDKFTIDEAIDNLESVCDVGKSQRDNNGVRVFDHARFLTLRLNLIRISKGEGKVEVSLDMAQQMWKKGPYQARSIRAWGKEYLASGEPPSSGRSLEGGSLD